MRVRTQNPEDVVLQASRAVIVQICNTAHAGEASSVLSEYSISRMAADTQAVLSEYSISRTAADAQAVLSECSISRTAADAQAVLCAGAPCSM